MKNKKLLSVLGAGLVSAMFSMQATATQFWSDYSVSYLQGDDYLNPFGGYEYSRDVWTLERASGHSWGSTFIFVDRLVNSEDGSKDETYGEIGGNYTLGAFGDGFFKDIYAAGQVEYAHQYGAWTNWLYGVGVNLNFPGASYFNVTLYKRNNDDLGIGMDDNEQVTIVWGFDWGNLRFDGFWDIANEANTMFGKTEISSNFTPQLKYNIGNLMGMEKGRLDVGLEYVHWTNKFGVDGADEKNVNLLVKWHF